MYRVFHVSILDPGVKMKNLAGETKADLYILEELDKAGIKVVEGERSRGEVPYTLTGKLGNWNFNRAWYYWVAGAQNGKGLPLSWRPPKRKEVVHSKRMHSMSFPPGGIGLVQEKGFPEDISSISWDDVESFAQNVEGNRGERDGTSNPFSSRDGRPGRLPFLDPIF